MSSRIQPYQPCHRDAVRRIYADTAFFGEPVEAYFNDRNLFADLGIDIYLNHYPNYTLVAETADGVAGYITGCPGGPAAIRRHTLAALPGILWRLATRQYRLGRRTLTYVYDETRAALRGELLEVRSDIYPANLHINLLAAHRGRGLGSALLRAYLEKLTCEGLPGVHAVATTRNQAALRLYRGFGFVTLSEKPTRMWTRYVNADVRLVALGLRLGQRLSPSAISP